MRNASSGSDTALGDDAAGASTTDPWTRLSLRETYRSSPPGAAPADDDDDDDADEAEAADDEASSLEALPLPFESRGFASCSEAF